jgi:hypothetical protein
MPSGVGGPVFPGIHAKPADGSALVFSNGAWVPSGANNSISLIDSATFVVGNGDPTKRLTVEVDNQTTATLLTLNTGAQTLDRTLSVPVLSGNDTIATLAVANAFSSTVTVVDGNFSILGSSDATKKLKFEVDTQSSGFTLTLDVGAQSASRTLLVPVLAGSDTIATLAVANLFSGINRVTNTTSASASNVGAFRVGDDVAATTVAIGGGNVNAGGTLTVAGRAAVGGGTTSLTVLNIGDANPLSGTSQNAFSTALVATSAATVATRGGFIFVSTAAAAFTCAEATSLLLGDATKGASSVITRHQHLWTGIPTVGSNNAAILIASSASYTGNWAIRSESTYDSYFAGTTEASAVGTASFIIVGGLGVAKRSYLGTIGSTFKGNVDAGVQDATAAVAGQVGEVLTSTVTGVAVAATGTVGNITSVSVTAGDWIVSGHCVISGGATGLTAASVQKLSIVTTTATNGTEGSTMMTNTVLALSANGKHALAIPQLRINISSTTTYYLTEEVSFTAGSPTAAATLTFTRAR